jgi:hypothetical protein
MRRLAVRKRVTSSLCISSWKLVERGGGYYGVDVTQYVFPLCAQQ